MPSAIDQALISLVPTLNQLPLELTSLAHALLMQSRSRANTLKPDEEIARNFVCAHIACEKLSTHLPPLAAVKPPVAPRVYKKLKTYFDGILDIPGTPRTPRHREATASRTPTSRSSASRVTASSSAASATPTHAGKRSVRHINQGGFGTGGDDLPDDADDTPSRRSEKRPRRDAAGGTTTPKLWDAATRRTSNKLFGVRHDTPKVPSWSDAVVASLVEATRTKSAASHIRAGLDHVLSIRGYDPDDDDDHDLNESASKRKGGKRRRGGGDVTDGAITSEQLPGLLVVLSLFVVGKMQGWQVSDPSEFAEKQHLLVLAAREVTEAQGLEVAEMHARIRGFLQAAGREGWLRDRWFEDVVEKSGGGEEGKAPVGDAENGRGARGRQVKGEKTPLRRKEKHAFRPTGDDRNTGPGAGLEVGLGTMFQDAVDWLSAERTMEYQEWRAMIEEKLLALEASA